MSYVVRADLVKRWGADWLPQKVASDGTVSEDADRINTALADASALVDTYLEARYKLPLDKTPTFLKSLTCDIARFRCSSDVLESSSPAKQSYDVALKNLKSIKEGSLDLVGLTPIDPSAFTEVQKQHYSPERLI